MNINDKILSVDQLCHVIDLLSSSMDDYLYVYDFEHDFYYISQNAVERFMVPQNSFHDVVRYHEMFVYKPDLPELQAELNSILAGEKQFHNMQYRWLDSIGNPVWINCRGYVVHRDNVPIYMLGCINEIGVRQKADNISGLLGESSLHAFLNDLPTPLPPGFMLRLGLDDFKDVNEKHGIEYGDMILKHTADCIARCISPSQKLYRVVGDEFMILDYTGGTYRDAIALYRKIRPAIAGFIRENHYESIFTISGGILDFSALRNSDYSNIMKLSEFALSESKRLGKNQYYHFNEDDYQHFLRKQHLSQILRQAVNHNFEGFEAYFQPLVYAQTGQLCGAETLMRFRSESLGLVSPAEFIPILEETGLIIPAGRWILHRALEVCKSIQTRIPDFKISFNISYIQVMKSDIIHEIISAVEAHGIAPSKVIVELTESGLMLSDARFTSLWAKLKESGIQLALDDFGTGYSNFHYLYDLRPDTLKIDRSFTVKALENEYDYNLLSLMSEMGHNLNLTVCVEGIETEDELARIKQLSPDFIQGFYFGRPCSYRDFVAAYL